MPEIDLGSVVGPQGEQGVPGPAGAEGKQGPQGQTGEAGKSAYQAAKDGGYTGTEADFNAIMAIIEKHARRHKAGGADPLTAADVGALRVYTHLSELGLTAGTETIDAMVKAMGSNSILLLQISTLYDGHNPATYPDVSGLLIITKRNNERVMVEFLLNNVNSFKKWEKFYQSGAESEWKRIATTDYAVNKAGDTMTGALTLGSGKGDIHASGTKTELRVLNTVGDTRVGRALTLYDGVSSTLENLLRLWVFDHNTGGSGSKDYNILHTGNKPSSSYNGDGNATAENLCTGATGNMAVIWGNGKFTVITENGGVCSDGTTLTSAQVKFSGGTLTVSTNDERVNKLSSPVTKYYWQVL